MLQVYMFRFVSPKGTQRKTFTVADSLEEAKSITQQRLSVYEGEGAFQLLPRVEVFTPEEVNQSCPTGRSIDEVLCGDDIVRLNEYLELQYQKTPMVQSAPRKSSVHRRIEDRHETLHRSNRLDIDRDSFNRTSEAGIRR